MTMRILLATNGRPGAAGAVRLARELERGLGAEVEVLRVIDAPITYAPTLIEPVVVDFQAIEMTRRASALEETRRSLDDAAGGDIAWPVRLEVGTIPDEIARAAADAGSGLIVLGTGEHDAVRRWFGGEMLARVAHVARAPILSVPTAAAGRPTRIVVGVDLSPFSRDALRAAALIGGPHARFDVVTVIGTFQLGDELLEKPAWREELRRQRLLELAQWMRHDADFSAERCSIHVLEGAPADAILSLAEDREAELIAVGAHGAGFLGRLLLGSVSTEILRRADCTILVAPPSAPAGEMGHA